MKLSQKSIEEFKKIYRKDFGVILNTEQAEEMASNFFQLIQAIYKPIPKKDEEICLFKKNQL